MHAHIQIMGHHEQSQFQFQFNLIFSSVSLTGLSLPSASASTVHGLSNRNREGGAGQMTYRQARGPRNTHREINLPPAGQLAGGAEGQALSDSFGGSPKLLL